jgi:predicted aspartyl protease
MSEIARALSVSMAAITLSISPGLHAEKPAPCQLRKIADLPVTVTPQNEILVGGKIAGWPVQFRVDTGSQFTVMDFPVAKRFGISVTDNDQTEMGVGGRLHFLKGTVPGFSVGDFPPANVALPIAAHQFLNGDAVGMVGLDMLGGFDVEFDVAAQKIVWFNHNSCPGEPIYWAQNFSEADVDVRDSKLIVTIAINGAPAHALLDTGMPVTVISWSLAHRIGIDSTTNGVMAAGQIKGPDGNPIDRSQYRFSEFKFGDEVVRNPVLYIANLFKNQVDRTSRLIAPGAGEVDIDAIVGADFIRSHHLYLETMKGKLYFTWNGGSIFLRPATDAPPTK